MQSGLRSTLCAGLFAIRKICRDRTARSGVGKTGSFAALNNLSASGARLCEPVLATTTGISRTPRTELSALAMRSTSLPTKTQKVATIASTSGSFARTSTHFSNRSGADITAAVTSTGFAVFP